MQQLFNKAIRSMIEPLFRLPFTVGRTAVEGGRVAAQGAAVAANSRQGRKDRADYAHILGFWEGHIVDFESLAASMEEARAQGASERQLERGKDVMRRKAAGIRKQESGGIIYSLDVLESRNTGMAELKARRAALEARQEAVERAILVV